jgi:iron complex transport system substrate-binding protein
LFVILNHFRNHLVQVARDRKVGGNDYWESAVVNPDIVLRDLIKIFHPELVEEPFVYYKQLF